MPRTHGTKLPCGVLCDLAPGAVHRHVLLKQVRNAAVNPSSTGVLGHCESRVVGSCTISFAGATVPERLTR